MNNKIFLKIESWSYYLVMFFLPISLFLDNLFLGILLFVVLLKKNKPFDNKLVTYSMFLFFIYIFFNTVLKDSLILNKESIIKILPILLLPFCLGNLSKKTLVKGCFFLMIGIVVIQINAILGIIDYYYFTEGNKYALKNYSKVNEIIRYERPYLGFLSAFNFILSLLFFKKFKKLIFPILISCLAIIIVILISARLALIIIFFSCLIYLLNKFKFKNSIIYLTLLTSLFVLVFLTNQSIKARFIQIKNDARLITWRGAYKIFNEGEKYITGIGSQKKINNLYVNYYNAYENYQSLDEKKRFLKKNYNTHNQYINELLRGGFMGLFLFLLPQYLIIRKIFKNNSFLNYILLFSIVCFLTVENVIQRQVGVYLYIIILSLSNILSSSNKCNR